jgi:hypothetical protein
LGFLPAISIFLRAELFRNFQHLSLIADDLGAARGRGGRAGGRPGAGAGAGGKSFLRKLESQ